MGVSGERWGPGLLCLTMWPTLTAPTWSSFSQSGQTPQAWGAPAVGSSLGSRSPWTPGAHVCLRRLGQQVGSGEQAAWCCTAQYGIWMPAEMQERPGTRSRTSQKAGRRAPLAGCRYYHLPWSWLVKLQQRVELGDKDAGSPGSQAWVGSHLVSVQW